jgi:hypothetical protein
MRPRRLVLQAQPPQKWLNLRPLIQEAYQRQIASGAMTVGQGGYASRNHFASLSTVDDVLDNETAKTIARTLTLHMVNLLGTNNCFPQRKCYTTNQWVPPTACIKQHAAPSATTIVDAANDYANNECHNSMQQCICSPPMQQYMPCLSSKVSSRNPPILFRAVDVAADIVVEDVPIANVAVEAAVPLCRPPSCMLAELASSHTSQQVYNHLFNNHHPASPTL